MNPNKLTHNLGEAWKAFSDWQRCFPPLLLFVFCVSSVLTLKAESFTIHFDESDYRIATDERGVVHISKFDGLTVYPEVNEPALPLSSFNIAINGNKDVIASTPAYSKRLIMTNVIMAQSPMLRLLKDTLPDLTKETYSYLKEVYPISNCQLTNTSEWSNVKILHYSVCPFVYDASKKELYFVDSIDLTLTTGENSECSLTKSNRLNQGETDDIGRSTTKVDYYTDGDVLKSIVSNPEDVDGILSSTQSTWPSGPRIDYLVITSQTLKEAFEPLVNWKHSKGLYTKIVTIDEIKNKFRGYETQFAIKCYLYELYNINSLKYVLLGGDDTVVPVRQCYSEANPKYKDYTIPTDMYYACFGGDLTWDGNNNGIYGELEDNVKLNQSIYVTRLPVRTTTDVSSYIQKLIAYEKNPKWSNKFLMCGNKLHNFKNNNTQSDAEVRGDILYENFIEEYWKGERYRFYDTCTDFPGGADYDFSADNLYEQLSQGYDFVDIGTHGSQTAMTMEKDPGYRNTYNSILGSQQINSGYSIITFVGCLTNAFDTSSRVYEDVTNLETCLDDPCLSESLIRNQESGVVAYLGCSRETWEVEETTEDVGTPGQFITYFYKNLFNSQIEEKNFGRVVATAKAEKIIWTNHDGYHRWLQFGLNPVGDPEMPIYINEPKTFDEANVSFGANNITINTGVPGCRVCIMSRKDNGLSYYRVFEEVQLVSVLEAVPDVSICITKQGYVPKTYGLISIESQILDNSIVDCSEIDPSGLYNITLQLNDNAVSPQIIVADLNGNIENIIEIESDSSKITLDLSPLRSGLHILSLLVDGRTSDFRRIVKE